MRASTAIAVLTLSVAGLGFWAGRSLARDPAPLPAAPSPSPAVAPPSLPAHRAARGLVCASIDQARRHADDPSCDALELRGRWCEAELDQCTRERKAVRQPWPDDETIEAPEAWSDAVEHALAECELGAELELVECSEYPCVAALRPADPALDEAAREQEMKRLIEAARACAPLRSSFGIRGPEHDEAIDVYRLDARCGEGRESFFVLSALAPDGPAHALLAKDDPSDQEERDLFRWLYRRADDVSGLWPCTQ
jgi:hypothetical protein